jgi:lipoprotein-releasing system permease protein
MRWSLFIARRYMRARRSKKVLTPSILSVGGIAVGVMTLLSVLGVMNGFQLGFIEDILEINSFHLRIYGAEEKAEEYAADIRAMEGIRSAIAFSTTQTLLKGPYSDYTAGNVQGMPANVARLDRGFMEQIEVVRGSFSIPPAGGAVIGQALARRLGVDAGETIEVINVPEGGGFITPESVPVQVNGIFRSGYYEYDSAFCFVSLDYAKRLFSGEASPNIGVKLENRFRDSRTAARIRGALPEEGVSLESWREYNRAFFGALRMEKLAMMVLIGLIFIVVAVNIKNSLERSVMEKREEIGALRALGGSEGSVRLVFILEGLFIGFGGAVIGTAAGLIITENINRVFAAAEWAVNLGLRIAERIISPFYGGYAGEFSIFSPAYFYIQEVPTRVPYGELLFIFLFAVGSAVTAAHFASKRVTELNPVEILYDE